MDMQFFSTIIHAKLIPFVTAVCGFALLIAIHEFGHFIFCKMFGIHTPTFSIGFGPELFSRKIGQTRFRIALIPFGGYCEIAGHAEVGQGEQAFADDQSNTSFDQKPYWQKALVLCGGIIFNMLFAYSAFTGLFLFGSKAKIVVPTVAGLVTGSSAEKIGLQTGDQLLQVSILTPEGSVQFPFAQLAYMEISKQQKKLISTIQENAEQPITLDIKRNDENITLWGTIGSILRNNKPSGMLGASFTTPIPQLPYGQAVMAGINTTHQWVFDIVNSFSQLMSRGLDGAGGPVMIISQTFSSAQRGLDALFIFLAIMSINLAVLNLLPLGILDGGQLLFITVEAIIRRKLPNVVKMGLNLISLGLFIGLAAYLTYKDIGSLFGKQINMLIQKVSALLTR